MNQTSPHRFKRSPTTASIPCHTKDIQTAVIRNFKYLRFVKQFNEEESVPNKLVSQFFKNVKRAKTLKSLNLKWSYLPNYHIRPEIVKSICKQHSYNIQEFDSQVFFLILPYYYRNLLLPLKKLKKLSLDNNKKDIKRLPSLHTLQELNLDLRYEITDYNQLASSVCHLPKLEILNVQCLPKSLNNVLSSFNQISTRKEHSIKFQVSTEGEQVHSTIPSIHENTSKKVTKMSFQYIHSTKFLDDFFGRLPFPFESLKALKLDFKNTEVNITSYFKYLSSIPYLEHLSLTFGESTNADFTNHFIKEFRVPSTLKTLDITSPISFQDLLLKKSQTFSNFDTSIDLWRSKNIFEGDSEFEDFLQSFKTAKNLKILILDFDLLEAFNPHYVNFFISIVTRTPQLTSLNIQMKPSDTQEDTILPEASFDLAEFLQACSKMSDLNELQISMPSFAFSNAVIASTMTGIHTFAIRNSKLKDEFENDSETDFVINETLPIYNLLKSLRNNAPNLTTLVLDFNEVIDQDKLLQRFVLLQHLENLRSFSGKFSVKQCDLTTVQSIGKILQSFRKLVNLAIRFPDSDSSFTNLKDYVKYHRNIRSVLIYFYESGWLDSDCIINPLKTELKEMDPEDELEDSESYDDLEENEDDDDDYRDAFLDLMTQELR